MIRIRRVVGDSMLPTLKHGQIVVAFPRRVEVNRVVIARVGKREVIKRVVSVSARGIELAGDNPNNSTDSRHYGPVDPRSVRAVVVFPYNL